SGMVWPPHFEHEKLDVYQLELKFMSWATQFLADLSSRSLAPTRERFDGDLEAARSLAAAEADGAIFCSNGQNLGVSTLPTNRPYLSVLRPYLSVLGCDRQSVS